MNLQNDSTKDYENPAPVGFSPLYPPYTITYKSGVVVNGAVGLKSGALRLEAEAGFHSNKVDKVIDSHLNTDSQARYDISSWTFMANGYYDFDWLSACVTPYVMGGLGSCRLERNYYPDPTDINNSSTQTSVVFAWQVGAGLGIQATKDITIDLGYRYLKPVDYKIDTVYGIESWTFGGSEFLAGLRYAL